jgi:hypothetical protein
MFARGSRYEPIAEATHTDAAGRSIRYKVLRIIPAAGGATLFTVRQDERLDRVAYATMRDGRLWWRIADAGLARDPDALVAEPGTVIAIPGPGG